MNHDRNSSSEVLVGLLTWNQKEDTLSCIRHLYEVRDTSLHIVIVDNASQDGSADAIRKAYPEVVILRNSENRGCAGGRNDLMKYFLSQTRIPYMMFLDNDAIVTPDCFSRLLQEIRESNDIGILGVKVYYADRPQVFWFRGGAQYNPWKGLFFNTGQKETDCGQYNKMEDVGSVAGGFTFFRREVAEKVPEIDERYFIYYEDPDWCYKVKKAGFRIVTSRAAKVYHKASSSIGMESPLFYYYRTRNHLLFGVRHAGFLALIPFLCYTFCVKIPDTLLTLWLSKQYRQIKGVLLGVQDFLTNRWFRCRHNSLYSA